MVALRLVHLVGQPHVMVQIRHLLVTNLAGELFSEMDTADVHAAVGLLVGGIRAVITLVSKDNL